MEVDSWGDHRLASRSAGALIAGIGIWRICNSLVDLVFGIGVVNAADEGVWPVVITAVGLTFLLVPRRMPLAVELGVILVIFASFPLRALVYDVPNPSQIYLYPVVTVLVFMWVGIFHPRWVSFALFPVAVICQVTGLSDLLDTDLLWEMAIGVTLVAMFVGIVLGEVTARVRRAHELDHRRVLALQELAGSIGALRGESTLAGVAGVLVQVATRSFHTEDVVAVVEGDGGRLLACRADGTSVDDDEARRLLDHTRAIGLSDDDDGTDRLLWIPLVVGRDPLAVVAVHFDEPQDEFIVYVAELFAAQATPVIEQTRLMEALVDDANRDELTGLGNRRFASAMLNDLQAGDAVILVDLDHFKGVNDTWGHAAGDQVLREIGMFLTTALRGSDRVSQRVDVARYGGEEFLLVLKQVGFNAGAVAERLVASWREREPRTTFSAGVAVHGLHETPETTLERADQALYDAKRSGRDRAVSAEDLTTGIES
jgi:diguanylate cyclase (GGDEF)-like protein